MNDKKFFVGIGAQKCGTTWLYDYFENRTDVYMSPIKELHYFDQIFTPRLSGRFGRKFEKALINELTSGKLEKERSRRRNVLDLIDRVRMNYDRGAYRYFFKRRVPASVFHFGEITPSYSMLPARGFRRIKSTFPSAKFIFLMRDPIERYYSALRMVEERGKGLSAFDNFDRFFHHPYFHRRGSYHVTLSNLYSVVPREDVFVCFYEELFNRASIENLCSFLGLAYEDPQFDVVVNHSPKGCELTVDMKRKAREAFDDVYAFCAKEFGDKLPAKWNLNI